MRSLPLTSRIAAFLCAGAALVVAGCDSGPSYPKARVVESMQELLLTDEHLASSVRMIDHTLAIQVAYPGTLAQTDTGVGLGPNFDEAIQKVLTIVHRVVLSTDAEIDFYVLLLSDPSTPGVYLTIVRYLDDIRRVNANMIDTFEMFARTIFELQVVGTTTLTLDQYVPREIRLEEFLSWQLARRIQHELSEEMQTSGASVGRCGGKFENGEFVFTLDVTPATGGQEAMTDTAMQQVFETSTSVIAKVLSSYRFNSFEGVRLIHPLTGRNVILPKTKLEVFR